MAVTDPIDHWQSVYLARDEAQTSWFRPHLDESLRLIDGLGLAPDAAVIDVGGGRSTLVDDLLDRGFSDLTVLDLSAAALDASRQRLGARADAVSWIVGDVLEIPLPAQRFLLWHDRAVFHFLTDAAAQSRYASCARRSLREGAYLLVATFAADGPEKCSGLPVCRYDAGQLARRFADGFVPVCHSTEIHHTPFGTSQAFSYALLRRSAAADLSSDLNARDPVAPLDQTC